MSCSAFVQAQAGPNTTSKKDNDRVDPMAWALEPFTQRYRNESVSPLIPNRKSESVATQEENDLRIAARFGDLVESMLVDCEQDDGEPEMMEQGFAIYERSEREKSMDMNGLKLMRASEDSGLYEHVCDTDGDSGVLMMDESGTYKAVDVEEYEELRKYEVDDVVLDLIEEEANNDDMNTTDTIDVDTYERPFFTVKQEESISADMESAIPEDNRPAESYHTPKEENEPTDEETIDPLTDCQDRLLPTDIKQETETHISDTEIVLGFLDRDTNIRHTYTHLISTQYILAANKPSADTLNLTGTRMPVRLQRIRGHKIRPLSYTGLVRNKYWSMSNEDWQQMLHTPYKMVQLMMTIFMLETTAGYVPADWQYCDTCRQRGLECVVWTPQAMETIARPGSACAHCRLLTRSPGCSLATRAKNGTRVIRQRA